MLTGKTKYVRNFKSKNIKNIKTEFLNLASNILILIIYLNIYIY